MSNDKFCIVSSSFRTLIECVEIMIMTAGGNKSCSCKHLGINKQWNNILELNLLLARRWGQPPPRAAQWEKTPWKPEPAPPPWGGHLATTNELYPFWRALRVWWNLFFWRNCLLKNDFTWKKLAIFWATKQRGFPCGGHIFCNSNKLCLCARTWTPSVVLCQVSCLHTRDHPLLGYTETF